MAEAYRRSKRKSQIHERSKLITCSIPKGKGKELMIFLRDELDINRMILKGARGTGTATPTKKGVGQQMEKDVVTIVVPEERADEVFEAIYFEMGIDHPHGGFLFMGPLHFATLYELPELPAEED